MTEVLDGRDPEALDRAAALLCAGRLVAFPTETVYGLGADGLSPDAVRRVFAVKGRPADNPVILHVASFEDARPLWRDDEAALSRAEACARAFWPGPLTLVLRAAPFVPDVVTAGLSSVAVRAPAHEAALALLARVGRPLAAPSANRSGRPSPTTAAHVLRTLEGEIDAVLDGGPTEVGIESTVLDVGGEVPRVLRPGVIDVEALRGVLGDVVGFQPGGGAEGAASPGLRHRHYAPDIADVTRVSGDAVQSAWDTDAALLVRASTAARLARARGPRRAPMETLPDEPKGYARDLYAALYRLEASGAPRLVVEDVPDTPGWSAVRDRLVRATAR